MASRIKIGNAVTSAANGESHRIRLDDPPYQFYVPANGANGSAWSGTVSIQESADLSQMPNNGGGVANDGVSSANAQWKTILTLSSGGDTANWSYPLYRIRVLTSGITGGNPNVYLLVGQKSLKIQVAPGKAPRNQSRQMQIQSD